MSDDSFDQFLGASACAWTSAESFKAAAESGDGRSWVSLLALANRLSPSVGVVQRRGSVSRGQRSPVQVCFPPARVRSTRAGLDLGFPRADGAMLRSEFGVVVRRRRLDRRLEGSGWREGQEGEENVRELGGLCSCRSLDG